MTANETNGRFFLGVDGGATKTVAVVADAEGRVLGLGKSGPVHIGWVGPDVAASSTREAVSEALKTAAVNPSALASAYLGMASVDDPDARNSSVFRNALTDLGLPVDCAVVDNDAYVGMAAAGITIGAGVVAGTGFTAVALTVDGRRVRLPWYVAGRGSGATLGRQAAMAALFHLSGAGPHTTLTARVLGMLGLSDASGLEHWLAERRPSWDLGRLASLVTEAADGGDVIAADMLRTAGMEYGLAAVFVTRAAGLDLVPNPCKVAIIGGVFRAGCWVTTPMREVIRGCGINAELLSPYMAPAGGAVALAWHRCGVAISAEAKQRFAVELNTLLNVNAI